MSDYLDTSVIVAALVEDEPNHEACLQALTRGAPATWSHALSETFATLTGGRLGFRVESAIAHQLLQASVAPQLTFRELDATQILAALEQAQSAGARGGAIYDYLHLKAARETGAKRLLTLNTRHFQALAQRGDPEITAPGKRGE